ncbi:MAG: hypothetical protein LQ342_005637 [Letrouitia transgressa]|nr:MAG: hypothetical protein LQ342_005637 [Letrouitia transgressa]
MASKKRKEAPSKEHAPPEKKHKSSQLSSQTVLKPEEPAFPRGGASVLTPLEHKRIQIQAKNDVLFEQATGKKAPRSDYEDEENKDELFYQQGNPSIMVKRKKNVKESKPKASKPIGEKPVRVEALSYKRLVPGSIVLGQVSQINRYDIALALPNNLTGFVPLTSLSDILTAKAQKQAEEDHDNEEDIDQQDEDELDLKSYCSLGQYLRAYVVSTEKESKPGERGKRHIELSINPRQANAELRGTDLAINSMIQATVKSVEDHGLVMDLGLQDNKVQGFMSSKELGSGIHTSQIREGTVFLCLITGSSSNGNVIKLSADSKRAGNIKKGNVITDAPTIGCLTPGTAIEFIISEVTSSGIVGKALGLVDVTADFVHSGTAASSKDLSVKHTPGSKIKGRIICTFATVEERKLSVSLLNHIIYLTHSPLDPEVKNDFRIPTKILPISSIVQEARVARVKPGVGLFVDVGVKGVRGYVHISMVSDSKTESLEQSTGPYKVGSLHKARVIGYNAMDGLFIASLQPKIITQPFLRLEDVKAGEKVTGKIERLLISEKGVNGIIVNISEGISGLVTDMHFSDIHLQHPEKKFREGGSVTARILSTNLEKRQMRLTLKKSLVNSEAETWSSYDDLKPGLEAPGTITNILSAGAVVQFYDSVRGFLPISEMSESYIEDPKQHFREGQVVNVRITSINPTERRMTVSCKDPDIFGPTQQEALRNIAPGSTVTGIISEKTNEKIIVELEGCGIKAFLAVEHLGDGSAQKCQVSSTRLRVGQTMKDLLVLNVQESKKLINLTSKPNLLKAAEAGKLPKAFAEVSERAEVQGYISNITSIGVFVSFLDKLTGLLLKAHLPEGAAQLPDFGMRRNQSVLTRVLSVDHEQQRFLLTMREPEAAVQHPGINGSSSALELSNPIDGVSRSINDFTFGKLTKAKIISVKGTQLNVQLADRVQGRVDVSEAFDGLEGIKDRKHPLKTFRPNQVVQVRILGMHDSRNHRFLPITHRGKAPVFELTAKPSDQVSANLEILTVDKVKSGSAYVVFVNNISEDFLWVNLSPNVRGRIRALDASDDDSLLINLSKNFPVGSALNARVTHIDIENNRLDLSARSEISVRPSTLDDLSVGLVLPGRVVRVTERLIIVQLTDDLYGTVQLVDLADDYSKASTGLYRKNQIVRVCVKHVDNPNKRVFLSIRPSKVLSSSLRVEDREINSLSDIKVNDILRGFVKNVTDGGLFISLAHNVTAYVRISDLSDLYLKDWKAGFQIDQLVKGRVLDVDPALHHVQMSLKRSLIDQDYQPPLLFSDLHENEVLTGKVRKVEDFGVFIVIDHSANVSGLCHRSQMVDGKLPDPRKLYEEGDLVKAKVLKIDTTKKQVSLGLKASFFKSHQDAMGEEVDNEADNSEVEALKKMLAASDHDGSDKVPISDRSANDANDGSVDIHDHRRQPDKPPEQGGLSAPWDWTGGLLTNPPQPNTEPSHLESSKKKRRRSNSPYVDHTADLDTHGPQSVNDFERLLLTQPHNSALWLRYMAFQLEVSEPDLAREVAERALLAIPIREQDEKLNIWTGLLNLETIHGNSDTLNAVFTRACQYTDSEEIHARLISILIQSLQAEKAHEVFKQALRKHAQSLALQENYLNFLFTTLASPQLAREHLPRAMQSLPPNVHLNLTSKAAQLEFTSLRGDPERGRTVFESLLATWPRRLDIWNVWLDLEIQHGGEGEEGRIRGMFEGMLKKKLRPRKAKWIFKKWVEWEEGFEGGKGVERVKRLAEKWVKKEKQREEQDIGEAE